MVQDLTHGNPLTAVMEDYLEAIYHIVKEHGYARSGQISARLGVHKATVTPALRTLQAQGFIDYEPYQDVKLTAKGEKEAKGIVKRHDIFYRLLHVLLGLEQNEASKMACEMEHAIPPQLVRKFTAVVENALKQKENRYCSAENCPTRKRI